MVAKNAEKSNMLVGKKKNIKKISKSLFPSNKKSKKSHKINKLIKENKIRKKKKSNEDILIKKKSSEKGKLIEKKHDFRKEKENKKEKKLKTKNKLIDDELVKKKANNKKDIKINKNNTNKKCTLVNIKNDILKYNNNCKIKYTKKSNIYDKEGKIKLEKKKKKTGIIAAITTTTTDNNDFDDTNNAYSQYFEEEFLDIEKKQKLNENIQDMENDILHINNENNVDEKFSKKFVNFLKNYDEEAEQMGNKNKNEYDADNDDYKYLSLKDDIYKIKEPNGKIDVNDLICSFNNSMGISINDNLKYLKNENMKSTNKRLSTIEEQKFNSSLSYIKNVENLNKFNKAVNIMQSSYQVQFGYEKGEDIKSDEFLNKNILKKYKEIKRKNNYKKDDNNIIANEKEVDKSIDDKTNENLIDKNSNNNVYENNLYENNEETFYDYDFEEEMKKNLKKSKMLIVSDDILKTEKEKKSEELKKIAQLKALLSLEHKKNAYKKRIKSKSYRKYLKIKEKRKEEKILNKLYSEYPDLARNISNYEQEYAKKRNLINNVKKRKTISLLNRYKNEELRKQILKSFQADKEEKNILRKIIEKATIEEDYLSDININSEGNGEINSDENASDNSSSVINEKKKKIKNELKKRNLLRFSFVKNAEENKKNDEIYKKRKNILNKIENQNEEKEYLSNESSEEYNNKIDNFIELKNEIIKPSEKEISKAKEQLKNDVDFLNLLKKNNILNMDNVLQDGNETNKHMGNKNDNEKNITNLLNGTSSYKERNKDTQSEDAHSGDIQKVDIQDEEVTNDKKNNNTINLNDMDDEKENKFNNIKNISDINAINNEDVLKKYNENIAVYNFEHNIYENYINITDNNNNRDNDEVSELSDSEKIKEVHIDANDWCNYNTLLEMEKKKIMKEKEILEKKRNIPLHSINVLNKKDKKFDKYYIDQIPYPYNKNEYEKTLNININKEMNDISTFRQLISPQIINKSGHIISPLNKNPFEIANILTLKRNKKKSKL